MKCADYFTITFAGISITFRLPEEIQIPEAFENFLEESQKEEGISYEVRLREHPLQIEAPLVSRYEGVDIYYNRKEQWRDYTPLHEKDGCQVVCYLSQSGKNVLYYPATRWNYYAEELHCLHLIGIEEILLRKDAFLLHSSLVEIEGKTVLFCGPSGVGKSTQADLWKKHLGAEILNGDRCVVRKVEDTIYGCGSPWAGTSGIYRKEMAPIQGIFLLKQGKENTIRPVKTEAFRKIYQQSVVNSWNTAFVEKITDLILAVLEQVPVYEVTCRPEKEAVELAYHTLFKGV